NPENQTITLRFDTERQPSFNRNFELLTNDLQQRLQQGFTAAIFAENVRQLERLKHIFDDTGAQIDFVPIPTAISSGFIDVEKKLLCYTDHQIFQRFHKSRVKQAY